MKSESEFRALAEAALLRSCAGSERPEREEALAAALRYGRPVETRAGKAFFYQGDKAEAAHLVVEGSARAIRYTTGGKGVELPGLGEGDWLGLPELVLEAAHPYDALAETACLSLALPRYGFSLASRLPAFASLVSRALAREELALHSSLADESPEERIVSFLLARRARIAGVDKPRVAVTQEKIARSIGVTRETVNKRLAALEARGLLRTLRGEIEVLDWEALAAQRDAD